MTDIPTRCPMCGQFTERPCRVCMGSGTVYAGHSEGQASRDVRCIACNGAGLVPIEEVRDDA